MAGPFPGMHPWLELPGIWGGVHHRLISALADQLQAELGDRYVVEIDERVYIEHPRSIHTYYPDVAVIEHEPPPPARRGNAAVADSPTVILSESSAVERTEPFLEIRDAVHGERVITVVEVLSPANKRSGPGREAYLGKQREVLQSTSHLVEIDLLRAGEHSVACPPAGIPRSDYRVVVTPARSGRRRYLVWAFGVRDRAPRVELPLSADDEAAVLDLGAALDEVWRRGGYANRIDGKTPVPPPISDEDRRWAEEQVRHPGDQLHP